MIDIDTRDLREIEDGIIALEAVAHVIATLPERAAKALLLANIGYTYADIGQALGCSASTVSRDISAAKRAIYNALGMQ